VQASRDLSDGQLLERFLAHHEDAAFSVLVHRHGPMVLSVCKRVLSDSHAAEDVFQATFMVLVRRAASLRKREPLAGWLHAVAHRAAMRASAQAATRRKLERRATPMPRVEPLDELTWQELCGVLDEEIARLPAKYRAPIVLCYLEGKSYDRASLELGWAKGTLARRLERARELLRQQLTRRGVALSSGVLVAALTERATATPVGALLIINTVKAANALAAGKTAAAACLSAQALVMAEQTLKGMPALKVKLVMIAMTVGLVVGAASLANPRRQHDSMVGCGTSQGG
jgi:RNA polymerase sigma factor (sigma-70 family)